MAFRDIIKASVYVVMCARNVLFSISTEIFFRHLMNNVAENSQVKKYIKSNLRTWLINDYSNVELIRRASSVDPQWVQEALDRGDEIYYIDLDRDAEDLITKWVRYLNTLNGDISRISVPQLKVKYEKYLETATKMKYKDGEEVIREYSNGFAWKRVFSKEALLREGELMNHCVGDYCKETANGNTSIYSLRDTYDKPHCTIEVRKGGDLEQVKGNSNKPVKPEYIPYVLDFLKRMPVKVRDASRELLLSGILFTGRNYIDLRNLPPNYSIEEDLTLDKLDFPIHFPRGLTITSLRVNATHVTFDQGLTVDGLLWLSDIDRVELPANTTVYNLRITDVRSVSIQPGFHAEGIVRIVNAGSVELPPNMWVEEDLILRSSRISQLPEGLHVGGVLNIAGTQIQEIPSSVSYGKLIADKSFHNKTFGVNRKAEMSKIMEELDDFDAFDWKPL